MKRVRISEDCVTVDCDCGCCQVEFTKHVFGCEPDDTYLNIAVLDSYYDHDNPNSIMGRIKRAAGVLFGKPIPFNDALITEDEFKELLGKLHRMADGNEVSE